MKLRQYIENEKITQAEFARRIGFARHNVNKIILEKGQPNLLCAYRIFVATGGQVTMEDLLLDKERKIQNNKKKKKQAKKRALKVVKRKKAFPKLK